MDAALKRNMRPCRSRRFAGKMIRVIRRQKPLVLVPNESVLPIVPGDLDMSTFEEIKKAFAAHAMWKTRLRRAIDEGESEFTVDIVSAC